MQALLLLIEGKKLMPTILCDCAQDLLIFERADIGVA